MADKERIKEAITKYFDDVQTSDLEDDKVLREFGLESSLVFELLCFIEIDLDSIIPNKEDSGITEESTIGELVEFIQLPKYV